MHAAPPLLDHIDCWVFDLDNTLYPASANLFALMDERMGAYICQLTGADAVSARTLQKRYFVDHGTTLAGLMAHHDVDPHHYLAFVHDIALDRIEPDPELAGVISALPGRKLVFTNADKSYAARVLERRGMSGCFEDVFDIVDARFSPKPAASAYADFCLAHGVEPTRAIMFEDMARNLRPAKEIGMATVWIDNGSEHGNAEACPSYIDHQTHDLGHWIASQKERLTA